ncbi:hypothetical protein [Psychrobacter lutiphocae]|uniref:hypothetical protein n=1 Tax=Psychrobacter lutiphocae TaxID=540500 RepID=UPI000375B9DE|nr:hypothetical protein [Psychrobacter lutiphocae]
MANAKQQKQKPQAHHHSNKSQTNSHQANNGEAKCYLEQLMSDTKLAKTLAAYYDYQRVNKVARIVGIISIIIYLGANILFNTPQRQQLLLAVTVVFFAFAIGLIFFVVRKALAFSSPLRLIAKQQNMSFKSVYEDFIVYADDFKKS